MLIISSGILRSGSTWQFNALRILLARGGFEDSVSYMFDGRVRRRGENELIKTHSYVERLARHADYVFTSHRDLRDALASLKRLKPIPEATALARLEKSIRGYQRWSQIANYDMRYEDMKHDPEAAVIAMASVLGLHHLDIAAVVREIEAIRPPPQTGEERREDPVTLLWARHITDGGSGNYREHVAPQTIGYLEARYENWLRERSYPMGAATQVADPNAESAYPVESLTRPPLDRCMRME